MAITATCATIAIILTSAKGGESINLKGVCERLSIKKSYPKAVTINASGAVVRGLTITGENVRWSSGKIVAPKGVDGKGPDVYGLLVRGARNVQINGVTFGFSRKAIVIDRSDNVVISNNLFNGYGEDGVIASATSRLAVERNRFVNVVGKPSECETAVGVAAGVSRRDCAKKGGAWTDGFHADAIQLRDGVKNAVIRFNYIAGKTQGITQMDTNGDAPLHNVLVADNEVWGEVHHITLGGEGCDDCRIERNKVRRFPGAAQWKAVVRSGPARRCGNDVQDEKPDGIC